MFANNENQFTEVSATTECEGEALQQCLWRRSARESENIQIPSGFVTASGWGAGASEVSSSLAPECAMPFLARSTTGEGLYPVSGNIESGFESEEEDESEDLADLVEVPLDVMDLDDSLTHPDSGGNEASKEGFVAPIEQEKADTVASVDHLLPGTVFTYQLKKVSVTIALCGRSFRTVLARNVYHKDQIVLAILQKVSSLVGRGEGVPDWRSCGLKLNGVSYLDFPTSLIPIFVDDVVTLVPLGLGGKRKKAKKPGKKIASQVRQLRKEVSKMEKHSTMPKRVAAVAKPAMKLARGAAGAIRLTPQAAKFALAISEPFHSSAPGVTNPAGYVNATQKATGHLRFSMNCGTTGFGYVLVSPTAANDAPCIWYTTTAYTGSIAAILTANNTIGAGWVRTSISNLPYTAADMCPTAGTANPPVQSRVIAYSVRVTYAGTVFDRGGFFYILTDPVHNGLAGAGTDDIGTFKEAQVLPITEEFVECSCHPINSSEDHFPDPESTASVNWTQTSLYPFSSGDTQYPTTFRGSTTFAQTVGAAGINASANMGSPCMIIGIAAKSSSQFVVEVIAHVEYVGSKPAPMATANYPDHVGAQLVKHAAAQLTHRIMSDRKKTKRAHMMEALKSVAKFAEPLAVKALESAVL